MSVVRNTIAAVELTVALVGVAVAVGRHPLVRAGLRAAPHLVSSELKQAAAGRVLGAAYVAGTVARRLVPRRLVG